MKRTQSVNIIPHTTEIVHLRTFFFFKQLRRSASIAGVAEYTFHDTLRLLLQRNASHRANTSRYLSPHRVAVRPLVREDLGRRCPAGRPLGPHCSHETPRGEGGGGEKADRAAADCAPPSADALRQAFKVRQSRCRAKKREKLKAIKCGPNRHIKQDKKAPNHSTRARPENTFRPQQQVSRGEVPLASSRKSRDPNKESSRESSGKEGPPPEKQNRAKQRRKGPPTTTEQRKVEEKNPEESRQQVGRAG